MQMVPDTKGIGYMVIKKEKELLLGSIVPDMKEIGKMIKGMEKE